MRSRRSMLLFSFVLVSFLVIANFAQALAPNAIITIRVVAVDGGELGGTFRVETSAKSFPGFNRGGTSYTRSPFGSLVIKSQNSCQFTDTDNGIGVSAGPIVSFRDRSGALDLQGKWLVVEAREDPLGLRVRAMLPSDGEAVCLAGGSGEFTAEVLSGSIVIEGS